MENKPTIKEIYDCDEIVSEEELYPLQEWYNQLINKTVGEISMLDLHRMLRQNEFLDIAMPIAIECLNKDVFIGELYSGNLLDAISKVDKGILDNYVEELKKIISRALSELNDYEEDYEGERDEIKEIINSVIESMHMEEKNNYGSRI